MTGWVGKEWFRGDWWSRGPRAIQRGTGTPCQRLFASGASLDVVYVRWAEAGFPTSWDADKDGIPCEKSYGEQP